MAISKLLSMQAGAAKRRVMGPGRRIRKVQGLRWAKLTGTSPNFADRKASTTAQLAGKKYERQFGKWLEGEYTSELVAHEPWIEFFDEGGKGFAAPDYLLFLNGVVVVFECKLTNTPEASQQLVGLYRPLVEMVFTPSPVSLVTVCRNLRLGDKPDTWRMWESECDPNAAQPYLQHWRP